MLKESQPATYKLWETTRKMTQSLQQKFARTNKRENCHIKRYLRHVSTNDDISNLFGC